MSATAPESGDPSAILWPPPPPYYKLFQPGKEDQWPEPPSPDEISKLTNDKGMYMMLGRVMEDCRNPAVKITVPEIDSDLLRYDPSSTSLKREMGKLVEELPDGVGHVVGSMSTDPATARDGLRQFETLVKSLYHGLEILRGHEAKRLALQLAREQVEDLRERVRRALHLGDFVVRSTLEDIRAATAQGREALGPVKDEPQPIDEIVSVKTEVAPSVGDPSPKRRKRRGRNTDVMDRTRQGQGSRPMTTSLWVLVESGDCNSKNRNGGLGAPEALAAMRLLVVPQEDSSEAAETDGGAPGVSSCAVDYLLPGLTPNIVSSRRSADQLRDMRRRIRSVKDRLHQLSSGNSTSVSVLSGGSSDRPDDDYSAASEQRGDVWQSLAFTTYPRLVPDHHSYKLPPTTDGPTVTRGSAPMGASSGSSQRLQRSAYGVSRDRYESTAAVLKKQLREHHRDELIAELTAKYASSPAAENGNSRPIVAPPRKPAEVYSGDERSVSHVLEESAIEALVRYRREFLDYVTKIRDAELERSDATSWYLCDVLTDQLLRECIDSVTDSVCDDVDTYVDRLIEFEIS